MGTIAGVANAVVEGGAATVVVVASVEDVVDDGRTVVGGRTTRLFGGPVGAGRRAGRGGAGRGGAGDAASGAGGPTWELVPMRMTGSCAGSSHPSTASSALGATAMHPAVVPEAVASWRKIALPRPITVGSMLKVMTAKCW